MTAPAPLLHAIAPLLLSAAATLLCYRAAGATAGLFFGGIAFAVLIVPPFVAAERTFAGRLIVSTAALVGTSSAWLAAVPDLYVTATHWTGATVLLIAFVAALAGAASAFRAARLPATLAAAMTVVVFALWLTWPIWLSPQLAGRERLVDTLTSPHPILALDGSLTALGPPWTERTLMYNKLSVLNQDVAYQLPKSIVLAVIVHLGIGCAGLLAAYVRERGNSDLAAVTPPPHFAEIR